MNKRDIASIFVAVSLLTACGSETVSHEQPASKTQEQQKKDYQYKSIDSLTRLKRIETPDSFQESQKGKVTEYFSFTCIHCFNVSPLIKESNLKLNGHISKKHLVRQGESIDNHRYKMSETFNEFGRDDLASEAFKKTMRGGLSSEKEIVKFIASEDTNGEMLNYYNSEELETSLTKEIEIQSQIIIPGTPYFIVDGTHTINTGKAKTWDVAIETLEKATGLISVKN